MGQTKVLQLSRNTLNTNLMHGHRDSSVSPCSLQEITEQRIFLRFILLRANQAKRYCISYEKGVAKRFGGLKMTGGIVERAG